MNEHQHEKTAQHQLIASQRCVDWLANNAVIFDTETTGLEWGCEIVEISIIDAVSGSVLLDTLVKPLNPIPTEATAIHGINNEMVEDAPLFVEIANEIAEIIKGRKTIAYNVAFDKKLLNSALSHFPEYLALADCPLHKVVTETDFDCAMLAYAQFKGDWNYAYGEFKWHSLVNAAKQLGVELAGTAHRSLYDCILTREVVLEMAKGGA